MAQTVSPYQIRANSKRLILCVKLAQFAYSSATPSPKISVDNEEACKQLYFRLTELDRAPEGVGDHHYGYIDRFARPKR